MASHRRFAYPVVAQMQEEMKQMNVYFPMNENTDILRRAIKIGRKEIPNRLGVHPMEGCDGTLGGSPDELTFRRYERFAGGGAGIIWVEASAVTHEGRANPRQLYLCRENKEGFRQLLDRIIQAAQAKYGPTYRPYTVIQLTHSGRYSKPEGKPAPVIAVHNPYLETQTLAEQPMVQDKELEWLEDQFVEAAKLAAEIGFDAVDIKSCHGYLNADLLAAYTREGKYGGSFENRTRFLCNVIDKIQGQLGDVIEVSLRLNAYDAIPYPHGWGVDPEDFHKPDLTEPKKLMKILGEKGIRLINLTVGNPYYNPHVGRPYDQGAYIPPQHQLEATAKLLECIREMQQCSPDMIVMATGFSWLREFGAYAAAGGIQEGWFQIAGFGRQAFAYPDFADDILTIGEMRREKCCIACGCCTTIMRDGGRSGCVPKDAKTYGLIYKEGREGKPAIEGKQIAEHIQ